MTRTAGHGSRVQVFVGESDRVGQVPRHEAILEYLRSRGAAGATVLRGTAGFGANSTIHSSAALRFSADLPVVVVWIDAPQRVDRLLPGLLALAGSGVVVRDEVEVVAHGGRGAGQLRFDLGVRDAMTAPAIAAGLDHPVRDAVEMLVREGLRAVPVTDAAGRLAGMLSNRDLTERAGLAARLELLATMPAAERRAVLERIPSDLRTADVMSSDPVRIADSATLGAAVHLMAERRLKRLPVVDEADRLVGVVSRSDVLRAVGETFPREPGPAPAAGVPATIGEVMRADAPTVAADADLAALLDAVVSTRLNRAVIVGERGEPLGVVSDADVLRAVEPDARGGVLGAIMGIGRRPPGSDLVAGDLVQREPLVVDREAALGDVARAMIDGRWKIACVVDGDGRLIGIVDRADLLRAAGRSLPPGDPGPPGETEEDPNDGDD